MTKLFLSPVVLVALLGSGPLMAIPQSFGGTFINAANNPGNVPLEEWFRDVKHWEPGSVLPGPWVSGSVPSGMMLSHPGTVFGITAGSAVVTRNDGGGIVSVVVFYDAESAKIARSDLHKRLSRAVALFTGADGRAAGYTVTLKQTNTGAVTATLTR